MTVRILLRINRLSTETKMAMAWVIQECLKPPALPPKDMSTTQTTVTIQTRIPILK